MTHPSRFHSDIWRLECETGGCVVFDYGTKRQFCAERMKFMDFMWCHACERWAKVVPDA